MAAPTHINPQPRKEANLLISEPRDNSHPLHLFISREDAKKLNVLDTEKTFYVSLWTRTNPIEDESRSSSDTSLSASSSAESTSPRSSSIFQRSFSSGKNYPEADPSDANLHTNLQITGSDVEIFTYVWVEEEADLSPRPIEIEEEDICFQCTEKFIAHYNIQTDVVYVRRIKAYPASSVVIGVNSDEAFKWLTKVKFCTGLLVEVVSHSVLVRTNDVFLAPYPTIFLDDPEFKSAFYFDMFVLECAPIQQGLITCSTEIVLSYIGEKPVENPSLELDPVDSRKSEKLLKLKKGSLQEILISEFARQMSDTYGSDAVRTSSKKLSKEGKKITTKIGEFMFETIPQESYFKRMIYRDQKHYTFDPFYFVGMSRKLMLQHGLFDESLVIISPKYYDDDDVDGSEKTPEERIGMVKCLNREYDRSKRLFISPLFLFNMLRTPPIELPENLLMKRYEGINPALPDTSSSQSWSSKLPLAIDVKICVIPSPNYSGRSVYDEALKQYFRTPRIVATGDLLAVLSSEDPRFWQNSGEDPERRFPCIYFKVLCVRGPKCSHGNYVAFLGKTNLVQSGSEHSFVPAIMQTYLSNTPIGFWDRDVLPGFEKYVDKMESFILPHLQTKPGANSLSTVQPSILISGPVGAGKTTLIIAVAMRLHLHCFKVNCHSLCGEASAATESRMKNVFNQAGLFSPCILLLQSVHALGRDRDGNTEDPRVANSFHNNILQLKTELQRYPVIVAATTHSTRELTHDMQECFLHEIQIEVPDEMERAEIVDGLLQNFTYSGNLSISYIAQRTAGFVMGDLAALIAHAKREAFRRILKLCCSGRVRPSLQEEEDLLAAGIVVQHQDFNSALDQLQAAHSDAIGAPKIPNVTWSDVGGLIDVKREILDTIQLPLQYPELLAAGLRRSGVLLYGPPGTGKTLLAKAVATECSLNFLSVKGPELINMYVGQSEENVREVFRRARSATPCVIFFDELDSLAPNRGKSGDSGGVMDRVVSQLLAELDGLNKSCDVFVIGATNRPDLLDPALLRPGRFDRLLYLGVCEDHESQLNILQALTRKFTLAPDCKLQAVAEKCPVNLTGADFYALCSDALLKAVKRKIKELESGEPADQSNIEVTDADFENALAELSPSVTTVELERYNSLKSHFGVKES